VVTAGFEATGLNVGATVGVAAAGAAVTVGAGETGGGVAGEEGAHPVAETDNAASSRAI
jgi:hypothetical protein